MKVGGQNVEKIDWLLMYFVSWPGRNLQETPLEIRGIHDVHWLKYFVAHRRIAIFAPLPALHILGIWWLVGLEVVEIGYRCLAESMVSKI